MIISRQTIINFIVAIMVTGCSLTGKSDLKRSSNNKLFDSSGFHNNKRRPLYNKKYISKAKQNIISNNLDDEIFEEKDEEVIDPVSRNVRMYKKMIESNEQDLENLSNKRYASASEDDDIDLIQTRKNLYSKDATRSKKDLENEIHEIKEMLKKTQQEIAKTKCPYDVKPAVQIQQPKKVKPTKHSKVTKKKPLNQKQVQHIEVENDIKGVSAGAPEYIDTKPPVKVIKKKQIVKAVPGAMTPVEIKN